MAKLLEYGVKKLRKIQFGIEGAATPGTPVLASTIWRGTGTLEDQRVVTRPDEDIGYLVGTDRVTIPMKGSVLNLEEVATFEQILTILETGIKTVTPAADGGGSGKVYTYPIAMTGAQTVRTRTGEVGDNQEMSVAPFLFTREFTISGSQKQPMMLSAVMEGRSAEPLIYSASLVYVNATKKITDAAAGLAAFLTGMSIRASGTVSDDGVYTVATGGVAGEIVVTETLPGETAVASILEQVFTAAATLPTVSEMLFGNSKVYIDASGGTIGTTQIANTILGMTYKCKTGQQAVYSADGGLDLRFLKQVAPEVSLDLVMEWNGKASAQRVIAKAGTAQKLRYLCEGPTLTTAGAYSKKSVILDIYGTWDTFKVPGEQDGDDIVTGTFVMGKHATANQIIVVNQLAAAL